MKGHVRTHVVVGIIALVVIAGLLVIYFSFDVYRGDRGINLLLMLLWMVLIILMIVVLQRRVLKREEIVRRFYLSKDGIYNSEMGYASPAHAGGGDDMLQFVLFAANSLVEMSYGFEVADPPDDFEPTLIITTETLRFHRPEGTEEGGAVIDEWKGTLLRIVTPGDEGSYELLGSYDNARELAFLLDEQGVFL
ncbi:MAG: hypothetical protein Q4A93_07230 [Actinomycetota bacterium]|nr:hypothetical protein [Actinomycetota bacterium]